MILTALYELAKREHLIEHPDLEKKAIDFVLCIDRDGRLVNVLPLRDEKGRGALKAIPRLPKRTIAVAPGFLADNAKYVLGLGGEKLERNRECVESFAKRVNEANSDTKDAGLAATSKFYAELDANRTKFIASQPGTEWTGSEMLAFGLADDDDQRLVHERPAVLAKWAALRQREQGSGAKQKGRVSKKTASQMATVASQVRCLVTGERGPAATLHPSIKRVPAGQSSGTALVSFNKPSFCSQGHEQGANAPVSREASEAYATALNWLLEKDEVHDRRYRYGVSLGADSVIVFWTKEDRNFMDTLAAILDPPNVEGAIAAVESPFKGLAPTSFDETPFYGLVIGGNAARVVVRDAFCESIGRIKENVLRYFDDLALGDTTGAREPLPLWQLLAAIDPPGNASVPPQLATRMVTSALRGWPVPREILRHALGRLRVPPDRERNTVILLRARTALIKAALNGLARSSPNNRNLEVNVSLDENNTQTGYVLGRLFAVLERAQGIAQGDVNATIRDRYFASASATPAAVFPSLLRLSVHHTSKVAKDADKGGLAGWLEALKSSIVNRLEAAPLPAHMSLEEQGLFAIGYYHQREDFFRKKSDAS